jgi:uncharacterized protein with GYD domain
MPRYVVLYKFTEKGATTLEDTVRRVRESRAEAERRGFKILSVYWTQGGYDLISTVEAPDEKAMMAAMVSIASAGNVRSETLRAFDETEMEEVLSMAGGGAAAQSDAQSQQAEPQTQPARRRRQSAGGQPAGKVNPIQVQKFLKGVNYPASKADLVSHAQEQGADENVRSTLDRLPDQSYETPADVSQAIGAIE